MYAKYFKRVIDFILSLIAIIVLSPLLLVLTIVGSIKMKGNPIFVQERIGRYEKSFKLVKFRTMTNEKDCNGVFLPDEKRLVPYGKYLRSTSLDELPELFNIFIGDMAIIGPRPLPTRYLPFFSESELLRLKVRGGLVPPEVLSGKMHTSWDEQLTLETEYAKHITFATDMKILINTFKVLFKRVDSNYGADVRLSLDEERRIKGKN